MPKRVVSERNIEDKILENMIELQKIHTGLAEKFDKLTKEISSLLSLFELAARSFSKNPAIKVGESDKEFLDKIDKLLEQNKTIAKGLTLMEEHIRKKAYSEHPEHMDNHEQTTPHLENPVEDDGPLDQNLLSEEYSPSMKSNNRPLPRF